jgi:hypothetical protein
MAEPVRARRLAEQEGRRLLQIVRRGKHGSVRVRRAMIIMASAPGRAWPRATYHRTHGIRYFHGCYCVGDDQLRGITREHKGAGHTLAALKSVRAARPDGYRLFVIMDNLAANKTPAIRRWARRENAGLCFTPANASRAHARHPGVLAASAANAPASAANASNAGAARNLKPHNRAGARS